MASFGWPKKCPHCREPVTYRSTGYFYGLFFGRTQKCDNCRRGIPSSTSAFRCKGSRCDFAVCRNCYRGGLVDETTLKKITVAAAGTSPTSAAPTVAPAAGIRRETTGEGTPPPLQRKVACRYGSQCYQVNSEHLASFAHPGDPCYRKGLVLLEAGQAPQLDTVWHIFMYFDIRESGHLVQGEFFEAAREVALRAGTTVESYKAWADAGGHEQGHIGFVQFAIWSSRLGLKLPVGLDAEAAPQPCRAIGTCSCTNFRPVQGEPGVCTCGHGARAHRTDVAHRTVQDMLLASRPSHWKTGLTGLVPIDDADILSQFQFLLDATHLESDNWTRDRGCALHGPNNCPAPCLYANKAPVPKGYRLVNVWRNQNLALWARYGLMRGTILHECSRRGCTPCSVESSAPIFGGLDTAALMPAANEWRLFHGTSEANCRAICSTNFNLTLTGTGGSWKTGGPGGTALYGPGIYLSERITKADEYSGRSGIFQELHYALLCRVMGGRPTVCLENEIDPDILRMQVLSGPFHSVLGDRVTKLRKPFREVVVYDKDQVYPEFLIAYSRIM